MVTKEILRTLRKNNGLTGQQVADGIDVSYKVYQTYESGARNAGLPVVEKLADFYNVSTDYLLGRTEKKALSMTPEDNRFEEELLEIYRSMPEEYRKLLYDGIKAAVLRHHNVPDEPGNEKPESGCTPMPWAKPEIKESKEAAARHTSSDNRKKTPPPDNILIEVTEDDGI